MKKDASGLWDELWAGESSLKEDRYRLAKEENSVRWRRIERTVLDNFGSFDGLRVIEIGAGAGTNAALMAKKGADITILDYSENAIKRARALFERNGLAAEFIKHDALSLTPELLNNFDICMSFGLSEHFSGGDRLAINKAHFDLLKRGGMAFISVPNKHNPPYRIYKLMAELTGRWKVGGEYPYSRKELKDIFTRIGITGYSFIGGSFLGSFDFINPMRIIKIVLKTKNPHKISRIKKEKGSPLDQYLAYALVICVKK